MHHSHLGLNRFRKTLDRPDSYTHGLPCSSLWFRFVTHGGLDEAAQAELVHRSESDTHISVESDILDATLTKRSLGPKCVLKSFNPDADKLQQRNAGKGCQEIWRRFRGRPGG